MYRIAEYIPHEIRTKVAEMNYEYHPVIHLRTTEDGFCPLGAVLRELMPNYTSSCPLPSFVSDGFYYLGITFYKDDCYAQAYQFIKDWDSGEITDLRSAFGVENDIN